MSRACRLYRSNLFMRHSKISLRLERNSDYMIMINESIWTYLCGCLSDIYSQKYERARILIIRMYVGHLIVGQARSLGAIRVD